MLVRPWAVFTTVTDALDWAHKESRKRGMRLEVRAPRAGRSTFTVVDADEEREARELLERQKKAIEDWHLQGQLTRRAEQKATGNRPSHSPRKGRGNVVAVRAVVETMKSLREGTPVLDLGPTQHSFNRPDDGYSPPGGYMEDSDDAAA